MTLDYPPPPSPQPSLETVKFSPFLLSFRRLAFDQLVCKEPVPLQLSIPPCSSGVKLCKYGCIAISRSIKGKQQDKRVRSHRDKQATAHASGMYVPGGSGGGGGRG